MQEGRRAVLTGIVGAMVGILLVGGLLLVTAPSSQLAAVLGGEATGPGVKTVTDTATGTARSAADVPAPPTAPAPEVRSAMAEAQPPSGPTPQTVGEVARRGPAAIGVVLLPFLLAGLVGSIMYVALRRPNRQSAPATEGVPAPS